MLLKSLKLKLGEERSEERHKEEKRRDKNKNNQIKSNLVKKIKEVKGNRMRREKI